MWPFTCFYQGQTRNTYAIQRARLWRDTRWRHFKELLEGWNFKSFRGCLGLRTRLKRITGFLTGHSLLRKHSKTLCLLEYCMHHANFEKSEGKFPYVCWESVIPTYQKIRHLRQHQIKKNSKSGGKPDTGLFSRSGFGWIITGNPRTKNCGGGGNRTNCACNFNLRIQCKVKRTNSLTDSDGEFRTISSFLQLNLRVNGLPGPGERQRSRRVNMLHFKISTRESSLGPLSNDPVPYPSAMTTTWY